jgi:excisionase family DNA binding protein
MGEQAAAMVDERLWTVAELAKHLQVTEWTVRQWLKAGRLHGYRPGGTKAGWRIANSEVSRFIQSTARDGEAE